MSEDRIHIDPKVKSYIRLAKEVIRYILSYWYLLIIFIVLAVIFGRMNKQPVSMQYKAILTFTVSQRTVSQQTNEEGEIANLINDFGIGSGNTAFINASRLIELSKSNAVVSSVLFRSYVVEGDTNYLANHFLNIYNPNITDSTYFEDFVSVDSLNRVENAVLNGVIDNVRNRFIKFTISPAQIFTLSAVSGKEELSKILVEAYYTALSELYVKGAIAKAEASFKVAESRMEEARENVQDAEAALASWQDRNRNLVRQTAYLSEIELQRQLSLANQSFTQALNEYNTAKFQLEDQRPIFQVIDPPRYPLQRIVSGGGSMTKIAIAGAVFLYIVITILLFLLKKYGYLLREIWEA